MRFHRGKDGWGRDSYEIPTYAVVGSSDCGTQPDSPAPSPVVRQELMGFRRVLRQAGISSRFKYTNSGNLFMLKRWVVVRSTDYPKALELAEKYLKEHDKDTRFIHDAT